MFYIAPLTFGLSFVGTDSVGWNLRVLHAEINDLYENLGPDELVDVLDGIVSAWLRAAAEEVG